MLALVPARSKVAAEGKPPALVLAEAARERLFPGGQARLGYPVLSRLRAGDYAEIPFRDLAPLLVELKRIAPELERDAGLSAFRTALLALSEKTRFDEKNLYAFRADDPPGPGSRSPR